MKTRYKILIIVSVIFVIIGVSMSVIHNNSHFGYPPPESDYTFGKVEVSYRNLPDLRASCAFDGQIAMWFYQFIVNPLCEIGIQIIPDYECNCN